jgi:hypothetical protein
VLEKSTTHTFSHCCNTTKHSERTHWQNGDAAQLELRQTHLKTFEDQEPKQCDLNLAEEKASQLTELRTTEAHLHELAVAKATLARVALRG